MKCTFSFGTASMSSLKREQSGTTTFLVPRSWPSIAKTRRHVVTLRRAPLAAAAVAPTTRRTSVSSSQGSLRAEFARRERASRASAVVPPDAREIPTPPQTRSIPTPTQSIPIGPQPRLKDPNTRASHRLPSVDASTPLSSVFVARRTLHEPSTGSRLNRNRFKSPRRGRTSPPPR